MSDSPLHSPLLQLAGARTILLLRTDAIGDNVLATALLEPLRAALPNARIVYACQDRAGELFMQCPYIDELITLDRGRAYADEGYRQEIMEHIKRLQPDAVLNPMLTREPLADDLVRHSAAPQRVGFAMNLPLPPGCRDDAYTHLNPPNPGWLLELDRITEFLRAMAIPIQTPEPRLWLNSADELFAERLFANHGLHPAKTVILFAGAGAPYRINRELAAGLVRAMPGAHVISVGAAHEFALHEELVGPLSGALRHLNLCGRTTLPQTAALIKKSRIALGAETGAAHLACAVGTPNVIILGGGHFGRFAPWSPLTTAACLPVACYRCNWKCTQSRAHCVQDISADTIATAIKQALCGPSSKPRLVVQQPPHDAPPAADVRDFLPQGSVEIIPASAFPSYVPVSTPRAHPRQAESTITATALVSTYQSARFIKGCLQDLAAQTLFQKGQLEILVIDSASPQNEAAIVREFQQMHGSERIRYYRTESRETLYAAWNRAIDLARGKYLTSANTDDRHHPDMLAILAATLDNHPQHALAYADGALTHDANATWHDARRVRDMRWPDYNRQLLFMKCFIGPHPMWRRSLHAQAGPFDSTMIAAGDYEFWLRLSLNHTFIHVPQALGLMYENFAGISLGNRGITWYESRVARARYWNPAWGQNPALAEVAAAFADLRRRAALLPSRTRFAIFGAGQHSQRHLAEFRAALAGLGEIVAILDDHAAAGRTLGELPVVQSERWRLHNIGAIVISSDTYEKAFAARASAATSGEIPVFAIYQPELDRTAKHRAAAVQS